MLQTASLLVSTYPNSYIECRNSGCSKNSCKLHHSNIICKLISTCRTDFTGWRSFSSNIIYMVCSRVFCGEWVELCTPKIFVQVATLHESASSLSYLQVYVQVGLYLICCMYKCTCINFWLNICAQQSIKTKYGCCMC